MPNRIEFHDNDQICLIWTSFPQEVAAYERVMEAGHRIVIPRLDEDTMTFGELVYRVENVERDGEHFLFRLRSATAH